MDKDTYKKYNVLKNNNTIYQSIWCIKNNMDRNAYIHYLYVCLNKDDPYIIHQYYTDNASVGMPKVLNVRKLYVYFNHYHYQFEFEIQVFKNQNCISTRSSIRQPLVYMIDPTSYLYQRCVKYNNILKQLLYLYIVKIGFPKGIAYHIGSYLMGEPNQISPDTETRTTPSSRSHSRYISV